MDTPPLGAACGYAIWWYMAQLFGTRLRQTPAGHRKPLLIMASFGGMFFFCHPFRFYQLIGG